RIGILRWWKNRLVYQSIYGHYIILTPYPSFFTHSSWLAKPPLPSLSFFIVGRESPYVQAHRLPCHSCHPPPSLRCGLRRAFWLQKILSTRGDRRIADRLSETRRYRLGTNAQDRRCDVRLSLLSGNGQL